MGRSWPQKAQAWQAGQTAESGEETKARPSWILSCTNVEQIGKRLLAQYPGSLSRRNKVTGRCRASASLPPRVRWPACWLPVAYRKKTDRLFLQQRQRPD